MFFVTTTIKGDTAYAISVCLPLRSFVHYWRAVRAGVKWRERQASHVPASALLHPSFCLTSRVCAPARAARREFSSQRNEPKRHRHRRLRRLLLLQLASLPAGNKRTNTMTRLGGLLVATVTLLLSSAAAIYPDGLWDRSTKFSSQESFDAAIQDAIDSDRTLFVRWIASEG